MTGLRTAGGMLDACFLGPYGENDALLEKLVVEFLRDHVYWRRNFHPEDPPAIPTDAAFDPGYRAFEARLRRELHALSAALKKSVPFHSPRYIGHMASDLLLPGLAAQILTLPYNPNNVSEDAAPVTVELEVEVGLQLARMVGYPHDPDTDPCAFGHLTSGGTVANYQALRLALALKAFPVALRATGVPGLDLPDVEATLSPANVSIKPGTTFAPLGSSSGGCYSAGCGNTGWIYSEYTIQTSGTYQLVFGVSNWSDMAWHSALAFDGLLVFGFLIFG